MIVLRFNFNNHAVLIVGVNMSLKRYVLKDPAEPRQLVPPYGVFGHICPFFRQMDISPTIAFTG